MKVLHLNAGNMFGGVETLLLTLAGCRELCPEITPSFGVCFEGRLSQDLRQTGVPVHILGEVRVRNPWSIFQARRRFRLLLAKERPDVVVCHMSWSHAVFGPALKQAGVPFVHWAHGVATGRHWLERLAKRTRPAAVITNSRYTEGTLDAMFPGIKRFLIYYPASLRPVGESDRNTARNELAAGGQTVIIQVSRMESWKGHQLLIEALAKVKDLDNWKCWIVGGAQRPEEEFYRQRIEQQIEEQGISSKVLLLGQRQDVPKLLAGADIFCQPNLEPEPFGLVFVEALTAGLPVVTTAIGGGAEIVTPACGHLVPPKDSTALAASLRRLILDSEHRRDLGRKGPDRARELCDPARQLRLVYDALESVA